MPDPQTPNLGLYVPLNGADVGTWDVPMNANFNLLDSVLGAGVSIALTNVPVTLSPSQYGVNVITFTGTLTGNVAVTFPAISRTWVVLNRCDGTSSFVVLCGNAFTPTDTYVAVPPNEAVMIASNGTQMRFVGLDRIGSYWDFAGSAVPNWVLFSNPPPYLNCDGTAFSSATYPILRDYLGGNTLPDSRGHFRATLNQGTARIQSVGQWASLDGDTLLAQGGNQLISQGNLPNYTLPYSDPGHTHLVGFMNALIYGNPFGATNLTWSPEGAGAVTTTAANTGLTITSGGSGFTYLPPGYVGGLTLIRAG